MARSLQKIKQDVQSLHASERNQLLRALVADVDDGEPEDDVEAIWLREAQRRYQELQNETVKSVPVEEVIRAAKLRLKNEG